MKRVLVKAILPIMVIVMVGLAIMTQPGAAERRTLEGWGPFKFGMTLQSARQASNGTATINDHGGLNYFSEVQGRRFSARLVFSGDGAHLIRIILEQLGIAGAGQQAARLAYEQDVADLTSKYGLPDKQNEGSSRYSTYSETTFNFKDGSLINVINDSGGLLLIGYHAQSVSNQNGF